MAVFRNQDALAPLLKRLQNETRASARALTEILELVEAHPDFVAVKNLWMASHSKSVVRRFAHKRLAEQTDPDLVDRLFSGFAEERGFAWVASLDRQAEAYRESGNALYFRLDGHLNNSGNAVVAELVSDELERLLELDPQPGPLDETNP